jgi:hypothetical protein
VHYASYQDKQTDEARLPNVLSRSNTTCDKRVETSVMMSTCPNSTIQCTTPICDWKNDASLSLSLGDVSSSGEYPTGNGPEALLASFNSGCVFAT